MWVCLNDGFVSIVAHRDKPGVLLVRARRKGDIEALLPGASVYEDDRADYRYRADVAAQVVGAALAIRAEAIDYDNFKNSVPDATLHNAYVGVWKVLERLQR